MSKKEELLGWVCGVVGKRGMILWGLGCWEMGFGGDEEIWEKGLVWCVGLIDLCGGMNEDGKLVVYKWEEEEGKDGFGFHIYVMGDC